MMKKMIIGRKSALILGFFALLCSGMQFSKVKTDNEQTIITPIAMVRAITDDDYIEEKMEDLDNYFANGNGGEKFLDDLAYLVDEAKELIEEFDFPLSAQDKTDIDEIIDICKNTLTQLEPKFQEINTFFQSGSTAGSAFIDETVYLVDKAKEKIKDLGYPLDTTSLSLIDQIILDYKDALVFIDSIFRAINNFMNQADRNVNPLIKSIATNGKAEIALIDFPLTDTVKEEITIKSFHIRNDVQLEYSKARINGEAMTGGQSETINQLYYDYCALLDSWKEDPASKYDTEIETIASMITAEEKIWKDAIFLQFKLDTFIYLATPDDSDAVKALIEQAISEIEQFALDHNYKFNDRTRQELNMLVEDLFIQIRNVRNGENAREFFIYLLGGILVFQAAFLVYSIIKLGNKKTKLVKTSSVIPLFFLAAMPEAQAMLIIYLELGLIVAFVIATWVIYYRKTPRSITDKNNKEKK